MAKMLKGTMGVTVVCYFLTFPEGFLEEDLIWWGRERALWFWKVSALPGGRSCQALEFLEPTGTG